MIRDTIAPRQRVRGRGAIPPPAHRPPPTPRPPVARRSQKSVASPVAERVANGKFVERTPDVQVKERARALFNPVAASPNEVKRNASQFSDAMGNLQKVRL